MTEIQPRLTILLFEIEDGGRPLFYKHLKT